MIPATPPQASRRPLARAVVALLLVTAAVAHAGDLDASQQQRLAALVSSMGRVETNLALAQQTAGPGDGAIPPSKARLVASRLANPASMLPQVRAQLALLPADHADVVALRARLDAAAAAVAGLEARLRAPTPAPAPGTGPTLDPRQAKDLADGRGYVEEVTGLAAALDVVAKEVAAAADPTTLDARRLATAMNTVAKARERAAWAHQRLDPLPADAAAVRAALDELATGLAAVDAAEARLKPVHERLRTLGDPATYPTLDADVRRLQELGRMYGDPAQAFANERARAAILVAELPAATTEHARLVAAYAALVRQQTEAGRRVEGAGRFCAERLAAFSTAAAAARAQAPADVDAAFAELAKTVETAVTERKPAFFTGGIPQRLEAVEERVALLAALDPAAGTAAQARLEAARTDLKARQASLAREIADANVLPPDGYAGPDRTAVEAAAAAAWRKLQPDAEVLATRIPSTAWHRETMWRRQGTTWYRIDRSHLQAQVIVRHDDRFAVIRPVDLWIDHEAGDERTAVPLDAAKDPVEPTRLLRLDRVK